jgi:RinA family phage transcriptional activator
LEREVFNHIAKLISDRPEADAYIKARLDELLNPFKEHDENIGGGKSPASNGPENTVITIADDKQLNALKHSRDLVDRCLEQSDSDTVTIIHELYFKRHPGITIDGVADKIHLSPSQVRRRRLKFFELMREYLGW